MLQEEALILFHINAHYILWHVRCEDGWTVNSYKCYSITVALQMNTESDFLTTCVILSLIATMFIYLVHHCVPPLTPNDVSGGKYVNFWFLHRSLQLTRSMKVSYGLCHMDTQLHHDTNYVQFWKQRSQQQNVILFHINAHFIYFNTACTCICTYTCTDRRTTQNIMLPAPSGNEWRQKILYSNSLKNAHNEYKLYKIDSAVQNCWNPCLILTITSTELSV